MEDLLTPLSQTYRKPDRDTELWTLSAPPKAELPSRPDFKGSSPEEALETLRSQPGYEELVVVLDYLRRGLEGKHAFNVLQPSPQGAQIVHVLVAEILPNYWAVVKENSPDNERNHDLDLLLNCLLSVTGINATLASLKTLLQQIKSDPKGVKQSHFNLNLGIALDFLDHLLIGNNKVRKIWHGVKSSDENLGRARALRQEFISLIASGKIVSLSAEAEAILQAADKLEKPYWFADNKKYVKWLGDNLVPWIRVDGDNAVRICADVFTRALKLGHADTLVEPLYEALILQDERPQFFSQLLDHIPQLDQRKVLGVVLKVLSSRLDNDIDESTEDCPLIWAAAGVLDAVVGASEVRKGHLVAWLTDATGAGLGESCGIRRAAVAVLGGNKERVTTVLEKSLNQFGDQLYVKHSPILQQEAHAQVLLLSAGYVYRISPIKLTILLRTGSYLNAISNRIGASQDRAKFLGMVVGEALSGMVHGGDQKLDFKMDEMSSDDAKWYKSLLLISDEIGPISPLRVQDVSEKPPTEAHKSISSTQKTSIRVPQSAPKSGFIIEEIEDDEEEEDDDLVPYGKPDSDAEDSDDDPTLISRDKPKAPVYIRDLIALFRDTENYDRQKLALATAPILIRRKANYGTEVSSHAEELATLLVGLSDKYDLDDFDSQRQQGMVAIIVAQPQKMGRWFAKTFFDGDYSLSQRASILIALGLSGREIAGYETSDYSSVSSFPSKQLPSKAEKHYIMSPSSNKYTSTPSNLKALPANALDNISQSLSQTFLAPLAAEAADAATGPNALKLSTFTSRLQDPSKVKPGSAIKKTGIRSIPNTTAQIIATNFFFPLTSRFLAALHSPSAAMRGILFQPYLLTVYLKTLSLLLHAAGPSTLALPQMTSEFWDLLLGVRAQCVGEQGVTQAVLFGLMALLDVNEGDMRGLCEQHGRKVVESVEWVSGVFDRTRGGDQGGDGEENRVKMMAAGILIRLREAVEKYRRLLMGDMIDVA
ncbi:telomere length regulation protein-domain-containing protein [Truncatella angustata]|uniref:Telomere length regulation protein-domain-containing protein n=1 Tax=Truncatella angustata TaxID=152316 RepID=A0A9P8UET2_9PEZI|nr:telomere length regulation protein-domain-containing protein [Truncatella angustata]KAH6648611.1 telomere length regulation protein-domain-containing protein [Truncatella angustata]